MTYYEEKTIKLLEQINELINDINNQLREETGNDIRGTAKGKFRDQDNAD